MKEFMMVFRSEKMDYSKLTPEQTQAILKQWQDWMGGIASKGQFIGTNRLFPEGKTIKANKVVSDGPYMEGKELIGGYLIVKADSIDEAVAIAKGCPVFSNGGHVEIRPVMPMQGAMQSQDSVNEKATA
jgi:hypothetical protein